MRKYLRGINTKVLVSQMSKNRRCSVLSEVSGTRHNFKSSLYLTAFMFYLLEITDWHIG